MVLIVDSIPFNRRDLIFRGVAFDSILPNADFRSLNNGFKTTKLGALFILLLIFEKQYQ